MILNRYSDKHIKILKAIGRYKFLTYKQMIRLGIDSHTPNLSRLVKDLRETRLALVKKIPHRTGTPAKFYLTSKAKKVLMELYNLDEGVVQFPKGVIHTDTQDQKHRTSIIDIQIELDLACQEKEIELILCDRYFDTTGNNRIDKNLASKTAIIYEGKKTLKADLTFMLLIEKQKELYLLELENGKDSKKAVEKCINYGKAILKGTVNEKYNYKKGFRTLWVFEYQSTLDATLRRLEGNDFFGNMREYFLFKSLEDIVSNGFFGGWGNLSGSDRKLYYVI